MIVKQTLEELRWEKSVAIQKKKVFTRKIRDLNYLIGVKVEQEENVQPRGA